MFCASFDCSYAQNQPITCHLPYSPRTGCYDREIWKLEKTLWQKAAFLGH